METNRRLMEGLEPRRLLAATLSGNFLYVRGTDPGDDTLYVKLNGDQIQVEINEAVQTFDLADVGRVIILGYGGNDHIGLQTLPFKSWIYAGEGNDTVTTSDAHDLIFGESGLDRINAGEGHNYVDAGSNSDRVTCGGGRDTVLCGNGNDVVLGGAGDDLIGGSFGNDSIDGGTGNDDIRGDQGNDTLLGGDGKDYLEGGPDNDSITGGPGNDRLGGASGTDTLRGEGGKDEFVVFDDTITSGNSDDYNAELDILILHHRPDGLEPPPPLVPFR